MRGCTDAEVAPPEDWAADFHALALGPATCGILRLLVELLHGMPQLMTAQVGWLRGSGLLPSPHEHLFSVTNCRAASDPLFCLQALPPVLCDVVAALASHPVAEAAAPDLAAWAQQHLAALRPAVAAQLQTTTQLARQKASLQAAVQQLVAAPTPALAAAYCRAVQDQLPALQLLAEAERSGMLAAIMAAAVTHGGASAAAGLAARLLLHHHQAVRLDTLAGLQAAVQQQRGDGGSRAGGIALLLHSSVAGSLVLALDEAPLQQAAAALLQAAAAADQGSCGRALLAWDPWLVCYSGHPTVGPAVASVLQATAGQKQTAWHHAAPAVIALFHASPAVASEGAAQLHCLLVRQRPATASAMQFNPLPFDGMLAPAGSGSAAGGHRAAAAAAARLFTVSDVQDLVAVATSPSVQPELAAAALGQLAQVADDERFAPLLSGEPGGVVLVDAAPPLGNPIVV